MVNGRINELRSELRFKREELEDIYLKISKGKTSELTLEEKNYYINQKEVV